MHENSMEQMRAFAATLPRDKPIRVADIGSCDVNGCYRSIFEHQGWEYTGYDIEAGKNVDVVCSADDAWREAAAEQYDVVISGQVLEHIEMPWEWIHVIAGFLKPGGLCCIIAPNIWGFHEYPKDCWRVWPDGLKALFRWGGLVPFNTYVVDHDTVGCAVKPAF
jgi:hypothetical protein